MPVNSFDDYPMSWRPKKEDLKMPLYASIAELLEKDILSGELPAHTKLPPQRELADFLDIGLSTVTRAFNICLDRGLLYATVGRGTFVSPNAGASIELAARTGDKPLIEMGIVRPIDRFNRNVRAVVEDVVARGYVNELLDYTNATGSAYHISSVNKWLEGRGIPTEGRQTIITFGAQNAVMMALMSFFNPGDRIAVDRFTYTNFIVLAQSLSLQLVPIAQDIYGMDAAALSQACKQTQIKGLYIMPSCCNPTGVMMSEERKEDIARVARENDLILLENGIYDFMMPGGAQPISALAPENTIYITSFSKSISSGLRVGAAVLPERFAKKYEQCFLCSNIKASSLCTEVLAEMLNSGEADRIIRKKLAIMQKRNYRYESFFGSDEYNINPYTFFRWLHLDPGFDEDVEEAGRLGGISVVTGQRFSVGAQEDAGRYIRVVLCSATSGRELERGLKILADIVDR